MNVHVSKWGNSLGVRIPVGIAKEFGIGDGTRLDLECTAEGIILKPLVAPPPTYSLEEMLKAMTPESIHDETDWGSAEGNELW